MKVKKMSFVLLIAFFISNTVSTVFASNLVSKESNNFYGRTVKKAPGLDFEANITRGNQTKIGDYYVWEFTGGVSFKGKDISPKKFEQMFMMMFIDAVETEINYDALEPEMKKELKEEPKGKIKIEEIRRISAGRGLIDIKSSTTHLQIYRRAKVKALKYTYKGGSIRGRVFGYLKARGSAKYYRIAASTKSKFWYPWSNAKWDNWINNENERGSL